MRLYHPFRRELETTAAICSTGNDTMGSTRFCHWDYVLLARRAGAHAPIHKPAHAFLIAVVRIAKERLFGASAADYAAHGFTLGLICFPVE